MCNICFRVITFTNLWTQPLIQEYLQLPSKIIIKLKYATPPSNIKRFSLPQCRWKHKVMFLNFHFLYLICKQVACLVKTLLCCLFMSMFAYRALVFRQTQSFEIYWRPISFPLSQLLTYFELWKQKPKGKYFSLFTTWKFHIMQNIMHTIFLIKMIKKISYKCHHQII